MFDWHEFLIFADDLFREEKTDVSRDCLLRVSISRAYYGAYIQTRNFFKRKQKFFGSGTPKDHQDLIDFCKKHKNYDVKQLGTDLSWLRDRRNTCDYDDELHKMVKDLEDTADGVLDRAFGIVTKTLKELEVATDL